METKATIQPLDCDSEDAALQKKKKLLIDPETFRSEYLIDKSWAVVPVESASHFNEKDVSILSYALASIDVKSCLAIITDDITKGPFAYRISTTPSGLMEFDRELSGLNALLVPEDERCAILCTVDLFYLVAGPRSFVAAAVGGDIAKARKEFSSFVSVMKDWSPEMSVFLPATATRYDAFEG
jgi:hypothetical protein